ncbi:ATP-binding protein [Sphingomonas desiccabilis]|uniref:Uncharacterized protein n=1 Tax=Sphingomonas desiccabilis TaxID=429134 RepID=A0A4Q2IPV2_9SPHN|nr:winged helix-turn-helix domain-containing protein [Sphingomonas desiccabilis]MBB3912096.1 putative ATPase/DNA-binding winged helix-turn-helix (wHTH) protein [Sphingomonas desiccabilis]RXZ30264.1 hypothetical protein EO081_13730 [Sphingomonas desiccabilis]
MVEFAGVSGRLASPLLSFGAFSFAPATQQLWRGGTQVSLGSRMADLLLALLARPGELHLKEELIACAWPGRTVEEVNLRTQIAALRRVLGCERDGTRFIATVPGRGYRFVAPVTATAASGLPAQATPLANLEQPRTPLIGRDQPLAAVVQALRTRRQVTIAGAGGTGKTAVALAAARAVAAEYAAVLFLDGTSGSLTAQLLSGLGITDGTDPDQQLPTVLRSSAHLLVVDGCEACIDEATELVATVLRLAARSALLLTSREPLRTDAETVLRLGPLDGPNAVELFVARAPLDFPTGSPDALAAIGRICRQLEGNPLAIELAAAQVDRRGLEGLADAVDCSAVLRLRGSRTATPRHRSLEASVAYDVDRLSPLERNRLLALSAFTRAFTLKAAEAIVADDSPDLHDGVAELASRSLLTVRPLANGTSFAMPRMVRLYAYEQLCGSSMHAQVMERLAEQLRRDLEQRTGWSGIDGEELACALDWCFAAPEREELALALTLAAVPFWFHTGAFGHALHRLNHAIDLVANGPRRAVEVELRTALTTLLATRIMPPDVQLGAASVLIAHAEAVGNRDAAIHGRWALWSGSIWRGDFTAARQHARDIEAIARGGASREVQVAADRLIGTVLHFTGEQDAALAHLDRVLAFYPFPEWQTQNIPFQYDQRIVSLCYRARILHLQGDTDQALRTAETALAEGEGMGHLLSITYALAVGICPILLDAGRVEEACAPVAKLRATVNALRIPAWQGVAQMFEDWLVVAHERTPRLAAVNHALASVRRSSFGPVRTMALCSLTDALARAGATPEALALASALIQETGVTGERWALPTAKRLRAELLLRTRGEAAIAEALAEASGALRLARDQGAGACAGAAQRLIDAIAARSVDTVSHAA